MLSSGIKLQLPVSQANTGCQSFGIWCFVVLHPIILQNTYLWPDSDEKKRKAITLKIKLKIIA